MITCRQKKRHNMRKVRVLSQKERPYLLSRREVAEWVGCSQRTVAKAVEQGLLEVVELVDGFSKIKGASVSKWLEIEDKKTEGE